MKKRSRNPGSNSSEKNRAARAQTAPRGRRQEWLFRIAAMVLAPLVFFGVAEAALRIAGYGYDTSFFRKTIIGNRTYLIENEDFSLRFFPRELVRTPGSIIMDAEKPDGVFRIFILGESAAMGDPEPAFGAARYLEVLLRERFPDQKFEVVNAAITAINSHVILPIARECARQQPDLWIIYMGNNEMVGPFGAATIFGAQAPPLWLARASLAIQRTRLGQCLMDLSRRLRRSASHAPSWTGMQMFQENLVRPNDDRRTRVYRNFRSNLRDILDGGARSGTQIILNTVAVNLKNCPPFASETNFIGSVEKRADLEHLLAEAARFDGTGNLVEEAQRLSQAAKLGPLSAETEFRWAAGLCRLTNVVAAREHFQKACDLDALPFRADSTINASIRDLGRQFAGRRVQLFDSAEFFATNVPAGVPGQETFYEHVHFNFDGNFLLARAWADLAGNCLPSPARRNAAAHWASQDLCERRLALTDWNRAIVIEGVIHRLEQPPMNAQPNNAQRLALLEGWEGELRGQMHASGAAKAAALYQEAIQKQPDDYYLHENYADFLAAVGDLKRAEAEWRQVRALVPHDYLAHFKLGWLLARQSRLPEAEVELRQAGAQRPYMSEVCFELAEVLAAQGKLEGALLERQRALRLRPHDPECLYQLGKTLASLNRRAEAIQSLQEAVRLRPSHWQAHYGLGGQLALENRVGEARIEFEQVSRIKPDFALAHLNLGVALMKEGRFAEAASEFEETARLDPANQLAPTYLRQARASQKPK